MLYVSRSRRMEYADGMLRRGLVVVIALIVLAPMLARGQSDTIPSPLKTYGLDSTEFFIGITAHKWVRLDSSEAPGNPSGAEAHYNPDMIWAWVQAMGANAFHIAWDAHHIDEFEAARMRMTNPDSIHYYIVPQGPRRTQLAGFGREIQYYLFDSVQSPYLPCKFLDRERSTGLYFNEFYTDSVPGHHPLTDVTYDIEQISFGFNRRNKAYSKHETLLE